jgi:hypothetical protein
VLTPGDRSSSERAQVAANVGTAPIDHPAWENRHFLCS